MRRLGREVADHAEHEGADDVDADLVRDVDAVDDLAREVHHHHSEDVGDGGGLGERPRPPAAASPVSVAGWQFNRIKKSQKNWLKSYIEKDTFINCFK